MIVIDFNDRLDRLYKLVMLVGWFVGPPLLSDRNISSYSMDSDIHGPSLTLLAIQCHQEEYLIS